MWPLVPYTPSISRGIEVDFYIVCDRSGFQLRTRALSKDFVILELLRFPHFNPFPTQVLCYARIIYPYWRERRQERDGHRVIPAVNVSASSSFVGHRTHLGLVQLDESDTKNESYICFRRREIKAIRKTRASQTSFSDRMVRLQNELAMALDIIRLIQQREILKQDSHQHASNLWNKRQTLADVKRAHPSLGTKEDDELFLDKERPPKKPRVETRYAPRQKADVPYSSADLRSSWASLKLRHPPRENDDVGSAVAPATPVVCRGGDTPRIKLP